MLTSQTSHELRATAQGRPAPVAPTVPPPSGTPAVTGDGPPQPPPTTQPGASNPGLAGLPFEALVARGNELSNQLSSATSRRDELAREIRKALPDSRSGLQQRLDQLDGRILKLESDIAANGQLKVEAAARKKTFTSTGEPSGGNSWMQDVDTTAVSVVFTLFVLCPIAISAARLMWKRASRPVPPAASRESELRLERVEQAVDAIAVEVERISEGQRFVTQLLSKPAPVAALGVGQAEPLQVPLNETVMAAKSFKAR